MKPISRSIPKKDHSAKMRGSAVYVADYPVSGMLFGRVLRSSVPRARLGKITLPELPDGYFFVDKNDITGSNHIHLVLDDLPVFADKTVEYIGDAIGILAGTDERLVNKLLKQIEVEYEPLEPVFDVRESDTVFFEHDYGKGDIDSAFLSADNIYEETFETGLQEHINMETNGMIAEFKDGRLYVNGSIQCPYYVHRAVVEATGLDADDVVITQDIMGGSFGKKEDYASILACRVAVAAMKIGKRLRVVFGRSEDIEFTTKRHPCICSFKAAVKDKKIIGLQVDVLYDSGAYTTYSSVVLQRGIISAPGVYNFPNLKVHGRACKTNTVPNGAFRGFGGPQVFFAIEMLMTHIAGDLGIDPVDFKLAHTARQFDLTSTSGKYHFPVPVPDMINEVLKASDYRRKTKEYAKQTGRFRRGIGLAAVFHGAGFTGTGERDILKSVARIRKDSSDNVEILTANTDMGQGLETTFIKIVAETLDLPHERIIFKLPCTARVPNSGPTVASRSIMIVGELLRRAAVRLKEQWIDGEEQTFEEHYKQPDFMISFDVERFYGDAYATYAWAVNAVEVEIDTLTGGIDVIGAYGSFDVGTPIDESIVIGQMEGGFLQSIGYAMMEKISADKGRIRNNSLTDYIIPTAPDVPNMNVFLHIVEYPEGPFGAKGAGELPHVGGAPAVIEAIQNALGVNLYKCPILPEDVMGILRGNYS